jgi:hypothetical protein
MARCPWNGYPCDCTGWVHTHPIPKTCEERTPVEMLAMYIQPLKISQEGKARYLKWVADGMPRPQEDDED